MEQKNFTEAFVEWVRANQPRLNADGITVSLPEKKVGNGTHADFLVASGQATAEIWDYGFSEFHVLGPQAEQVNVTHYEFQDQAEMYAALEALVSHLSEQSTTGPAHALAGKGRKAAH